MKVLNTWLLLLFVGTSAISQEKQVLNLALTEQLFIEQNLELIAEKYNIRMAEAERIQARLWPNPELNVEIAMWDYEDKKWFRNDYYAQRVFEVNQLIELGRKRKKRTEIADRGIEIAQLEFYETVRNLKNELRTVFIEAYFMNQRKERMEKSAVHLNNMITAYTRLFESGHYSRAELTRLKTLLTATQMEVLQMEQELIETTASLRILLGIPNRTELILEEPVELLADFKNEFLPLDQLLLTGLDQRADLQVEVQLSRLADAEISMAKSEAIPDLNIGAMYDRRGAEQWDYVGLTFGIELPLFDRNQGEIKKAQISKEQAEINVQKAVNLVEAEILESYHKFIQTQQVAQLMDDDLIDELDHMITGAINGFERQNISILEFIDYFESYNEGVTNYFELRAQLFTDRELINYSTGIDFNRK